ncbi:MAG: sugar 3,4-ketoisomerase [Brevinema sp.]
MKGFNVVITPKIAAHEGTLSFFEKGKEIAFDIKRIYYIYDLPLGCRRGFHAHKELQQVLFCPWGRVDVILKDGKEQETIILDSPEKILVLEAGLWREFLSQKEGSILCVGASDIYKEDDYIRDYTQYIQWVNHEKNTI